MTPAPDVARAVSSSARAASTRLVLGLMSGTSVDGIDVALVRIAPSITENAAHARLENFATMPFPAAVRAEVLRVAEGTSVTTGDLSQLNFRLGQLFAEAALRACRKFRVAPGRISLIGSHGQTVFHQGRPSRFLGASVASTLQIGEPAVIAGLTGITTVGDFRPADMAVGGQGAPLVPFGDYLLYRDAKLGRVALNIGGIANVTVIPGGAQPENIFAFDTGPGNMVIDALVARITNGRQLFDRDAKIARTGEALPELLDVLLADEYFKKAPPKSAGREQYGAEFVDRILAWGKKRRARPEDLIRTTTLLTALSIADAWNRYIRTRADIRQLIVSGGGARNPLL